MSPVRLANFLDLASLFPEPAQSRIRLALAMQELVEFVEERILVCVPPGPPRDVGKRLTAVVNGTPTSAVELMKSAEQAAAQRATASVLEPVGG